jgi:ribosome recycling factor
MAYNFSPFKEALKGVEEHLKKEYLGIRTGRATPALLDGIQVESYGARMPINQVAGVMTEDARTLRITPWDMSVAKEIEKVIIEANLGVSVSLDDKGARVSFPELSAERRDSLIKIAKERLEDSKVSVRREREKVQSEIEATEKAGAMSEDDKFKAKADMQKIVDEANKALVDVFEKKEKEIQN